ncbi:putative 26S proteasome regulatory subunit, variant 2 [Cadophora gregata]|uniref:putative 26S proteasome regulatory subunit, variant 2 n=1 Tax=Cadophora gregata TaxID=51156 RepID=UPI0026DD701A|nr:putative 26S proteasome regulatory subunit, variant 2 [Cadophora gregata]KAK0123776.1 putative 26S proteasome regulatory subunit, variant 2 [Cadophora gregata]KAK0130119.1 putative 26S proteasome regulatory subunit, variant 2 [Cadophora gregata f. sp. sojae]
MSGRSFPIASSSLEIRFFSSFTSILSHFTFQLDFRILSLSFCHTFFCISILTLHIHIQYISKLQTMAFLLSNMLAACKIKPSTEAETINQPKTIPSLSTSTSTSSTTLTMRSEPGVVEAEGLILRLLDIHAKLEAIGAENLKPCDEVDVLFVELVGMCIKTISDVVTNKILSDPRMVTILPSLHKLCGTAECHLESHWAAYISGSSSSTPEEVHTRLTQFPYYTNYTALTRLELSALSSLLTPTCPPLQKFAFIGSGPLPLTSLCIYQTASSFNHPQTGQTITPDPDNEPNKEEVEIQILNIDISSTAIAQSTTLCAHLGPHAKGLSFQLSPGANPSIDLTPYDVVYLAALAGSSQFEKEDLLENVVSRMRAGSYLVIRSAERLRRVLYAVSCSILLRRHSILPYSALD